jgi:hypothetical protein
MAFPWPVGLYTVCETYLDTIQELIQIADRTPGTRYENCSPERQVQLTARLQNGISDINRRIRYMNPFIFAHIMNTLLNHDPEDPNNYIPCKKCWRPMCAVFCVIVDIPVCMDCTHRELEDAEEADRMRAARAILEQVRLHKSRRILATLSMVPHDVWSDPVLGKFMKSLLPTHFLRAVRDIHAMQGMRAAGQDCGILIQGDNILIGTTEDLRGAQSYCAVYYLPMIGEEIDTIKGIRSLLEYCERVKRSVPTQTPLYIIDKNATARNVEALQNPFNAPKDTPKETPKAQPDKPKDTPVKTSKDKPKDTPKPQRDKPKNAPKAHPDKPNSSQLPTPCATNRTPAYNAYVKKAKKAYSSSLHTVDEHIT